MGVFLFLPDPMYVFEASLWNDRMLGRKGSLEEMVVEGMAVKAVATALYCQHTVQEVQYMGKYSILTNIIQYTDEYSTVHDEYNTVHQ